MVLRHTCLRVIEPHVSANYLMLSECVGYSRRTVFKYSPCFCLLNPTTLFEPGCHAVSPLLFTYSPRHVALGQTLSGVLLSLTLAVCMVFTQFSLVTAMLFVLNPQLREGRQTSCRQNVSVILG